MNIATPLPNKTIATHVGNCGCERLGICQGRADCELLLLAQPLPHAQRYPIGLRPPFAPGIIDAPPQDDGWFWPLLQRAALLVAAVGVAGFCAGFLTGCPIP